MLYHKATAGCGTIVGLWSELSAYLYEQVGLDPARAWWREAGRPS